MHIHVWHGARQRVGHLGHAQDDFNVMGEVSDDVVALSYVLGSGLSVPLSIGRSPNGCGDTRRLARSGHFNADIPIACFDLGDNEVVLTAKDMHGEEVSETVMISRETGSCSFPVSIDWSLVGDPQDVGQSVDGHWGLDGGGIRTLHTGYDRVFLIGETAWQDYEVMVPVTINQVDVETGPVSGGNGLGILFRFCGHVIGGPSKFPPGQPKWGYQPFGAIAWLRWMDRAKKPPQKQFYTGGHNRMIDHGTYPIIEGNTYWMKARCETLPNGANGEGVTKYNFKIWTSDGPEPHNWDWEEIQTSQHALRNGGVVLLAHHVDATFGNVVIEPLSN
ncbi:MAG: hypothetical protein HOH77_06695 [Candidatus Latescibacteria bacterium]|nr:hypothetical protein [Candidatus Latescibacterota bacterium]